MNKKIDPENVTLICTDTDNEKHTQQVNDLVETGTMINPDTGEELVIQHIFITEDNTQHHPKDVTIVYLDEHNNTNKQSIYDAVIVGATLSNYIKDTIPIDHIII